MKSFSRVALVECDQGYKWYPRFGAGLPSHNTPQFLPVRLPDIELTTREVAHREFNPDFHNRSLLLSQAVVSVGSLEHAEDDRSLEVRGAALVFKLSTNGASDTVFIHLADVVKQVAGLGASFVPLLEELLELHSVGAEAPGAL